MRRQHTVEIFKKSQGVSAEDLEPYSFATIVTIKEETLTTWRIGQVVFCTGIGHDLRIYNLEDGTMCNGALNYTFEQINDPIMITPRPAAKRI